MNYTEIPGHEKRTPEKANIMFLGTPIGEGTHNIVLKYHTPGLTLGLVLFVLGIASLVIICKMERKRSER